MTADGVAVVGQLARVEMLREHHEQAIEIADRALRDAEALALRPDIADLLITKGSSFGNLGRTVEGRALIEAGIRIADEDGLVLTGLRGRINLSGHAAVEPRVALEIARAGVETARRIGNRRVDTACWATTPYMALTLGAWDQLLAEVGGRVEDRARVRGPQGQPPPGPRVSRRAGGSGGARGDARGL